VLDVDANDSDVCACIVPSFGTKDRLWLSRTAKMTIPIGRRHLYAISASARKTVNHRDTPEAADLLRSVPQRAFHSAPP